MGGLSCKFATKEDDASPPPTSRRVKRKLCATIKCESATAVLDNFDLLQQILLKLAPGNGCSLNTRLQIAQVCSLWRDVSRTLPVSLQLLKPLTEQQVDQLVSARVGCIRHIGFSGTEEHQAIKVLASEGFQQGSGHSLRSLTGLPLHDNMDFFSQFPELHTIGLCKRSCHKLMDIVRGRTYSLGSLKGLKKLRSLTLRDLAGPRAGLDLSQLPSCLKDLHLVNTCFVHHPHMALPDNLHLECLTAYTIGRSVNLIPVELLKRTKQAIVRGKAIHLSGRPKDFPEMEEDSMEVIINGGMIFLFAFGVPQVIHEDNATTVMHDLIDSDLQVLRLCTEDGGVTSLVSRSDCRKGLRWKSAEVEDPSSFMSATSAVGESPAQGFSCRVENQDGLISCVCLTRVGTPEERAKSAIAHLNLQQMHIRTRMEDLEEQVRTLTQLFSWQE